MRSAAEAPTLQLEFFADQCVQIDARDDDIPPQRAGRFPDLRKAALKRSNTSCEKKVICPL